MKILISAAEASSDAHGAALLRALRAQAPAGAPIDAFGIGGPRLRASGLRVLIDARELLAMGFSEILGRLPRIFRALGAIAAAAESERPDVAVVIDYPDFHFRLARRLRRTGIPVIYYIPPKVWVWRTGRVRRLRELFAKVLCILPFEEEFYRKHAVAVKYVGNPLVDELPLGLTRAEARAKLRLPAEARVVVLMPGSRPSEFLRHTALMLEAADAAAGKLGEKLVVLMPIPVTASLDDVKLRAGAWLDSSARLEVRLSQGDAAECLVAADAGLIKSGTSTLEAGLLACPHAVVYRPGRLTAWIFKYLIRYRGPVGLVNLVGGWKPGDPYIAPEILCEQVTAPRLAAELVALLTDTARRARMISDMKRLRELVAGGSGTGADGPSARAAREIFELVARAPRTPPRVS